MFSEQVSFISAFIAGFLSFLSPCVLPLIPAYFTFITGYSIEELTENPNMKIRRDVFLSTVFFIAGFSLVFILMGVLVSFIGDAVNQYRSYIRIIGGILIIFLGLHISGLIHFKKLDVEKRIQLESRPLHFFGPFIVGMAFGAGWSPCIGPLLGSILAIAATRETVLQGVALLSVYAAGLAIPFMIIAFFIQFLLSFIKKASGALRYINPVAGTLLIVVGVLLLTDKFSFFINI